jgi:4'-phosphopantetheinyl transferase
MINIFYTSQAKEMPEGFFQEKLASLPLSIQEKNRRLVQKEDKSRHLLGKLLLQHALARSGVVTDPLLNICEDRHMRPFLPGTNIDFNISHSGNYIVCAITNTCRVGIDVEQITAINFADFTDVMSADQWQIITQADSPFRLFFTFWTIKESVVKADSAGLTIPLTQIQIENDTALCNGKTWHLKLLHLDTGYCCCLASSAKEKFELEYISLY